MKMTNIEIRITEAIDGYRLDLNDFDRQVFSKLNPETLRECTDIVQQYLKQLKELSYEVKV